MKLPPFTDFYNFAIQAFFPFWGLGNNYIFAITIYFSIDLNYLKYLYKIHIHRWLNNVLLIFKIQQL